MQRVAIVSSTFPGSRPGGVPTYVEGRAARLARRCEVKVFALGQEDTPVRCGRVEQAALAPPNEFRKRFLFVWWRLLVGLIRYRPTRVEIHNIPVGLPVFILWRSVYFFHGPAGMEAQLEGSSRVAVAVRNSLEVAAIAMSRRVCVVSKAFLQLLMDIHPRITQSRRPLVRYPRLLVPAGSRPLELPSLPDVPGLTLVCVRRLVRRTGVRELIVAFCEAVERGSLSADATLHIVGQGPELEPIRLFVGSRPSGSRINLHGRLSNQDRSDLFRRADWNIVPTQGLEGFGLVVVEAALEGCPSLVTDVGALPEVIEKLDGFGRICERSVQGIAEALGMLRKPASEYRQQLLQLAHMRFSVHEPL
jgi:glycosyltransferase involved in cell wall biosynthesis